MSQQPAGWYDDPETEDTLRYWDGVQWTHHTSPRHRPSAAPAGGQQAQGQYGQPGAQQPNQGGQTGGASPWSSPQGSSGGAQGAPNYPSYPQQSGYGAQGGGNYGGTWQQGGFSVPSTADGQPLASWLSRLGARLIDWLLVLVVTSIATVVLMRHTLDRAVVLFEDYYQWVVDNPEAASDPTAIENEAGALINEMIEVTAVLVLVYAVTWFLYDVLFTAWRGATLGKMAVGIHVRAADGPGRLNPLNALARSAAQFWVLFAGLVPYLAFLGMLYFVLDQLWPLWDDKRQALHDKAGRTQVVKGPRRPQA